MVTRTGIVTGVWGSFMLAGAAALAVGLSSSPRVQAAPVEAAPSPIFKPILATLRRSHVPLVLPSAFPGSDRSLRLYAVVDSVTQGQYSIIIGYTRDCSGGTACRFGTVTGTKIRAHSAVPTGKTVRLARGFSGHFVDATCGANCSDSTLTWDERGYRYSMGIKAGRVAELTRMANSAITATPFM